MMVIVFGAIVVLVISSIPLLIGANCFLLVPRSASLPMKLFAALPGLFLGVFLIASVANWMMGSSGLRLESTVIPVILFYVLFPLMAISSMMMFWEDKEIRRLQFFNIALYLFVLFIVRFWSGLGPIRM